MNWTIHEIFFLIKFSAVAFLIFSSYRLGLVSKYPLVFVYVFWAFFLELAMIGTHNVLGSNSLAYSYFYLFGCLSTSLLASAVLLRIYALLHRISLRGDWHLVVVPALLAVFILSDSRKIWFYFRLIDIGYASLTYIGAVTVSQMRRNRDVHLGWNLKMVLLALTLPAAIYSLVFAFYTLGFNLSKEDANLWMNGISVMAWIILAIGLSEYSPPIGVSQETKTTEARRGAESQERPKQKDLEKIGVDLCGSC